MAEISDAMLDGTLCASCGEYLGGTEHDMPLLCSRCAKDRRAAGHLVERLGKFYLDAGVKPSTHKHPRVKLKCPTCGRMVKAVGLSDHTRTLHAAAQLIESSR